MYYLGGLRTCISGPEFSHAIERFGLRVGGACGFEEACLTDLIRKFESHVIVGKNMRAVFTGHYMERMPASLGQDDGRSRLDGGQLVAAGVPAGTEDVAVCFV